MLLTKMTKQLVSWPEICQDWGLWSLILVNDRQNQFPLTNQIPLCEMGLLPLTFLPWLGTVPGEVKDFGVGTGNWRWGAAVLQNTSSCLCQDIPAQGKLRGRSCLPQRQVTINQIPCSVLLGLPLWGTANHPAVPWRTEGKVFIPGIYSCSYCFLNNICITTLNSFF